MGKIKVHLNGKIYEVKTLAQACDLILQEGKKAGDVYDELRRR